MNNELNRQRKHAVERKNCKTYTSMYSPHKHTNTTSKQDKFDKASKIRKKKMKNHTPFVDGRMVENGWW